MNGQLRGVWTDYISPITGLGAVLLAWRITPGPTSAQILELLVAGEEASYHHRAWLLTGFSIACAIGWFFLRSYRDHFGYRRTGFWLLVPGFLIVEEPWIQASLITASYLVALWGWWSLDAGATVTCRKE